MIRMRNCMNCGHQEYAHMYSDEQGHSSAQPCCETFGQFKVCGCTDFIAVEEVARG